MRRYVAAALVLGFAGLLGALNAQTPEIQKEVDITLDLIRLEGVWKPVSLIGPKGRVDKYPIANERLIFKANTFQRKEGDKVLVQGYVTIDPTKNPKAMDWEIEKPMPQRPPVLQIYHVDGDRLQIATATTGAKIRPATFEGGANRRVVVYERQK
jgi:uncharacterized protein (TIGR03067 family)